MLAAPATVVMVGVVPVRPPSVAVTVVAVPDTVWVVSVTVATPLASVVEVAAEKDPFESLLLQVTVRPEVATAFPLASANWAVIVTPDPAAGE